MARSNSDSASVIGLGPLTPGPHLNHFRIVRPKAQISVNVGQLFGKRSCCNKAARDFRRVRSVRISSMARLRSGRARSNYSGPVTGASICVGLGVLRVTSSALL